MNHEWIMPDPGESILTIMLARTREIVFAL